MTLPCPFCGGSAAVEQQPKIIADAKMHCMQCGATGPSVGLEFSCARHKNAAEAQRRWDARHAADGEDVKR